MSKSTHPTPMLQLIGNVLERTLPAAEAGVLVAVFCDPRYIGSYDYPQLEEEMVGRITEGLLKIVQTDNLKRRLERLTEESDAPVRTSKLNLDDTSRLRHIHIKIEDTLEATSRLEKKIEEIADYAAHGDVAASSAEQKIAEMQAKLYAIDLDVDRLINAAIGWRAMKHGGNFTASDILKAEAELQHAIDDYRKRVGLPG